MEDKYLVKAKRTDNREWVVGGLVRYGFTGKEKYYIVPDYASDLYAIEIDPNTICRCTGLKDENGKQIWENDVVKEFNSSGDEWNLSQIVFGEYSLNLGWCAKGIKTLHEYSRRLFNVGFGTSEAGKCEVIGNTFDSSELLEVE